MEEHADTFVLSTLDRTLMLSGLLSTSTLLCACFMRLSQALLGSSMSFATSLSCVARCGCAAIM